MSKYNSMVIEWPYHDRVRQAPAMPSDMIGLLAGGMAHDINNLLQVISGNLSLLARDFRYHTAATQRIDAVLSSVRTGAEMTRDVMSFCRDRVEPTVRTEIVEAARYAAMKPLLADVVGAGISVRFDIAPDLWPVRMNYDRFQNALLNLAINARDAINGRGCLTIRARNVSAPGPDDGEVLITVSDNGAGIADEDLANVFNPFFTTKPRGSGLGLANVASFARGCRAGLAVESEPGVGTTFSFAFPREAPGDVH